MNASFKISVDKLNPEFIQDLKEKYGEAELEITVNQSPGFQPMKEEAFWAIISLLDWDQSENEKIVEPVIEKLSSLSAGHIYNFQEILSQKLFQLDTQTIAENIGKYSYTPDSYFSVDHFLHARASVIANGQEAYKIILSNPSEMFKDLTFEPLLSIASTAYMRKTNNPFIYIPSCSPETFSNKQGWSNLSKNG